MMAAEYSFENFIRDHEAQLLTSGVPAIFWETLHEKLKGEVYDAGLSFQMTKVEKESGEVEWRIMVVEKRLSACEPENIFLIDHAWSFSKNEMMPVLRQHPQLLDRLCGLMQIDDIESKDDRVEEVSRQIWKFVNYYQVRIPSEEDPEAKMPTTVWYVMDEFGSRIQHSDQPTSACVPLFYVPRNMCFSVLWALRSLDPDEILTRDFIPHVKDKRLRPYRLLPWKPRDFSDQSSAHVPLSDDFFMSHNQQESLPDAIADPKMPSERKILVYAEVKNVREYLTDDRFEITGDEASADICWYYDHFKDFEGLSRKRPNTMVNQFPNERILTVKDLLAAAANSSEGDALSWHPETYNLVMELPQFVAEFQKREKRKDPNYWILKPWNLGRGLGIVITQSLPYITRLVDTIPMIASRYIHQPLLFYRKDIDAHVKFDVRYMLMVRSVKPLKCFAYNIFWLRFANKHFELTDLDDYQKHFTVMNYTDAELKQINCEDFKPLFDEQNPGNPWAEVEAKIHDMLRNLVRAVTREAPPKGLAHSPQSRAIFAVDLMLEKSEAKDGASVITPFMCEANFQPDCDRACKYHPFFFNDMFTTLFLDEPRNCTPLF